MVNDNSRYITFSFWLEARQRKWVQMFGNHFFIEIITLSINPVIQLILTTNKNVSSLPKCLMKYRPIDIRIATTEGLILWACISKCHFVLRFPTTAINPGGNRPSQRRFMAQRLPFHSAGGMVLYAVCSCVTVLLTGTVPKPVVFSHSALSRCSLTDVLIKQEVWNVG